MEKHELMNYIMNELDREAKSLGIADKIEILQQARKNYISRLFIDFSRFSSEKDYDAMMHCFMEIADSLKHE